MFLRLLLLLLIYLRLGAIVDVLRPRFGGEPLRVSDEVIRFGINRDRKKKSIERIAIAVDQPDTLRFELRAEGAFDSVGKSLGIVREWQTADAAFDRAVFVVSGDPQLLEALSADAELRRLARQLVVDHRADIHCTHGQLWVSCPANDSADFELTDPQVIASFAPPVLPLLLQVRERLRVIAATPWSRGRDPARAYRQWLVGLCALFGVAGIAAYFWDQGLGFPRQMVFDAIVRNSAWTTVGVAVVLLALLIGLIRRSAYTHLLLVEILLVGIPGAWFTAHASHVRLNQHLDAESPTDSIVRVTRTQVQSGRRGGKSYYLTVESWPDERAATRIKVTNDQFRSVREGSCVEVTWHRGRYGDPWMSRWRTLGPDCLSW